VSTRKLVVPALGSAALLVAVVCLMAACGTARQPDAQASPRAAATAGATLTAEQVYQRYGQGVVQVIAASSAAAATTRTVDNGAGPRGLGFAVSHTLILTSARLVDHDGSIAKTATVIARTADGQERRTVGAIVCVDAALDLAVIRVDAAREPGLVALPMGDSTGLRAGQSLTALGDPLAASPTAATLVVTAPGRPLRATSGVTLQAIVLSGPSLAGQSGAPLFDASGRVLAVVDSIGAPAGEPRGVGTAVPINDAAHVIADALAD
jgi:putative serine protease PepD